MAIKEPKGERHGHVPYRKKGSTSKHQESESIRKTIYKNDKAVAVRRPLFRSARAQRRLVFFAVFKLEKAFIYIFISIYIQYLENV